MGKGLSIGINGSLLEEDYTEDSLMISLEMLMLLNNRHFPLFSQVAALTVIFLLLAGVLFPNAITAANPDKKLVAAVYYKQPPHSYIDEMNQPKGILIEFFKLLEDQLDISIEYQPMPHGRGVAEILSGGVDMALLLVMPEEIKLPLSTDIVMSPAPVFKLPLNIYFDAHRERPIEYPDSFSLLSDLKGLRVGFLRAGVSEDHVSLHTKSNIFYFNKNESAIKSLIAERIDLVVLDPLVVNYWNNKLSISLKKKYSLVDIPVHIAFSRKSLGARANVICDQYWTTLIDLKRRDQLDSIFSAYEGDDVISYVVPLLENMPKKCQTISEVMTAN